MIAKNRSVEANVAISFNFGAWSCLRGKRSLAPTWSHSYFNCRTLWTWDGSVPMASRFI